MPVNCSLLVDSNQMQVQSVSNLKPVSPPNLSVVSPGAGFGDVPVVHDVQVPNPLEETEPGDGIAIKSRQSLGVFN